MVVEHGLKNVTLNNVALQHIAHGVGSYNRKMADMLKAGGQDRQSIWGSFNQTR